MEKLPELCVDPFYFHAVDNVWACIAGALIKVRGWDEKGIQWYAERYPTIIVFVWD